MPNFDGTGPMGLGPRTGRGLGPCGRGLGWRMGYGHGFGYGYRRFASPKNELNALEDEIQVLEEELKALKEEKVALEEELKDQK
jgi:hypothetical protein